MEETIKQLSNIEKMANEYFSIEEKILSEVYKLPNHGKECDCLEPDRFCIVDCDTIVCRCLNCGGNINW